MARLTNHCYFVFARRIGCWNDSKPRTCASGTCVCDALSRGPWTELQLSIYGKWLQFAAANIHRGIARRAQEIGHAAEHIRRSDFCNIWFHRFGRMTVALDKVTLDKWFPLMYNETRLQRRTLVRVRSLCKALPSYSCDYLPGRFLERSLSWMCQLL